MKTPKIIFHIDLNCFFASCEMAEDPDIADKPVAVAHLDPLRKGIILSPNYLARKYNIKTTMLVREALLLCKDLVVVEPDMELYETYSQLFHAYLLKITNLVEMASIDEAYLDVTSVTKDIHPLALAEKMQKELLEKYKLPVSIGIAPNKFLAKMASDMKKPLGITVLRKREIDQYLWILPIEDMLGVGKKTAPKLRSIGINTIGDLANYSDIDLLKKTIGEMNTLGLRERAFGIDDSLVNPLLDDQVSSISNAHTFDHDLYDPITIKKTLKVLANSVSYRLQNGNYKAQTVGIQVKYSDFHQINRSKGLYHPVNNENDIYDVVEDIFDDVFIQGDIIRLVGVFANRLITDQTMDKQVSIFDDLSKIEKETQISKLILGVQKTFGKDAIKVGYYEREKKENNE
ncbi:MAG: DNA polymerase IV [Bacilli bacterium]|jgi:DNA polymerase-4|nr:DNA polymerase IV [Bacilli bacterium]